MDRAHYRLYFVSFFGGLIPAYFQGTDAVVCKIIETFAEVLVVGGVAGTLVNTAQNMGTTEDFEIIEQTEGHLVARSNGLILNKQGYLNFLFGHIVNL